MKLVLVVFMLRIYMCTLDHDGNVFFSLCVVVKRSLQATGIDDSMV